MLCVFDCESIPDVKLLREIYGYGGNDMEVCNIAFETQKQISGSEFLPLPFHKIISISALFCDENGSFIKIGNFAQQDSTANEEQILREFLEYMNKYNPKLVSFNGRNFDLPVIMLRAMKYNIPASAYFEQHNISVNKSKWDNYRSRYSESFHIDLLDSLSSFGASRGMKLDMLCKMLNLPGKFDVSGDDVFKLYYEENNLKKINEYCQSDVLNTYWLFLKYKILQGQIMVEEYMHLLGVFLDKIPNDRNYSAVFINVIKKELQSLGV